MSKNSEHPTQPTIASTADRHKYYEKAVQCVEPEIDFVEKNFIRVRAKKAITLREDFCGTAKTCCEWIKRGDKKHAFGLDLSQEVLDWGMKNNISKLTTEQQTRIEIINADVLEYGEQSADIILAMNFSYQIFKTRDALRSYFENAYRGLSDDGILFIDSFGGHESWREVKEKTKFKKFTYFWHQKKFDPITHDILCHIHFKFKDGSTMKKAFTYDWRMWTLPELQELMHEAGFSNVTVYWEETDPKTGEGNGEYNPAKHGEDDPSWIVYLSAEK